MRCSIMLTTRSLHSAACLMIRNRSSAMETKKGWDERRLRKLGDEALRKLDAGESEKDVEGWVKAKFQ